MRWGLVLTVVLAFAGCGGGKTVDSDATATRAIELQQLATAQAPTATATPRTIPAFHQVYYHVTATRILPISVTYSNGNGGIEQVGSDTTPWSIVLTVPDGQPLSLSAQTSTSEGGATLTCEISVDDQIVNHASSTGPFVVVSCSSSTGA